MDPIEEKKETPNILSRDDAEEGYKYELSTEQNKLDKVLLDVQSISSNSDETKGLIANLITLDFRTQLEQASHPQIDLSGINSNYFSDELFSNKDASF